MHYIQRVIAAALWAAIAWVAAFGELLKAIFWVAFMAAAADNPKPMAMQGEALGPMVVWTATVSAFIVFSLGCLGKLPATRTFARID